MLNVELFEILRMNGLVRGLWSNVCRVMLIIERFVFVSVVRSICGR